MRKEIASVTQVYLITGYTDLRYGLDKLAEVVQGRFSLYHLSRALFLFCERRRDRIKAILWEGDGFLRTFIYESHFKKGWTMDVFGGRETKVKPDF